jgi:predicted RNA-binding Zn-ribbon protein involved in translation (DUF1610 family)
MLYDRRVKGCPNENCEMCRKKVKQKPSNDYCPKCGTRLIFVCKKCFKEIQNIDEKHYICDRCGAAIRQKKSAALEIAKNGLGKAKKVAVDAAVPVIIGVAAKVEKDMQKGTIDKGVKLVEEAAKVVLKKG